MPTRRKKKPLVSFKPANDNKDRLGYALLIFERLLGGEERLKRTIQAHSFEFGTDGSFVFQFRAKAKDGVNRVAFVLQHPDSHWYDVMLFRGSGNTVELVRTLSGLNMARIRQYLSEYLALEL